MDINRSVEEAKIRDIDLIDVRTPEEFKSGHIPNSINIPLNEVSKIKLQMDKLYYLYCLSGHRSQLAEKILKERGYHVESIGGINDWTGEIVH